MTLNFTSVAFFTFITVVSLPVISSASSLGRRAKSEKALFVNDDPFILNLKNKDGEWLIETQSNRVLLITFPDADSQKELIDTLTIYDGADPNESAILFPSVYNSSNAEFKDRYYSNGSAVAIRFRHSDALQSSFIKFQLKFQKAVPCPENLKDDHSSCARLVDEVSCHCATFTQRNWAYTRAFCRERNMTFLHIDNFEEDSKVYHTWVPNLRETKKIWGLWIGASDRDEEGRFVWDDGEQPISPGYTNWGPSQPDDANDDEDCLVFGPTMGFTWYDTFCKHPLGGVCEEHP